MKFFTRFLALLLPIIAFSFFSSCDENGESPDLFILKLDGQVVDVDGNAIENAVVSAIENTTGNTIQTVTLYSRDTTNADGKFVLTDIPADLSKVKIVIEHKDYLTYEESAETIEEEQDDINGATYLLEKKDDCCNVVYVFTGDAETEKPIKGVLVQLKSENEVLFDAKTNEYGVAVFDKICDGEYWLRIAGEGYKVIEKKFSINKCDTFELVNALKKIEDECCDGKIIIRPVDSETRKPIEGAKVRLWQNGKQIAETIVRNGVAYFEELCEGGYGVDVLAEGYKGVEFELNLPCNKTIEKIVQMTKSDDCCKGVVKFIVRGNDGKPLNGAKVTLWFGDHKLEEGITKDGKVIFDGLCEGTYGVGISKDGYKGKELHFELGCNEQKIVEINLQKDDDCCRGILRVKVQGENGELLNGAFVKLFMQGQVILDVQVRDGWAVFEGLCEGKYGAYINMEGYEGIEFNFELGCNEEKVIEQTLKKKDDCCKGVVLIKVQGPDGKLLDGAKVTLWFGNNKLETVEVRNGVAGFDGLCEGRYGVDIEMEGYEHKEFGFELGCNERKTIEQTLQKNDDCCEGVLKVYVYDKNEKLLSGAIVKLRKNGQQIAVAETREGLAAFDGLCEGEYEIAIIKEGYEGQEKSFYLDCNEKKRINVMLAGGNDCCDGVLSINVLDKSNQRTVDGAVVKLWKDGKLLESQTTRNGRVIFDNLCEGKYGVDIMHEDYKDIEFAVALGCNEEKTITQALTKEHDICCTAVMKLIIKDQRSEEAIEGATVIIRLDREVIAEGRTGRTGIFEQGELCAPKTYVVVIEKDGYQRQEFEWTFKECKLHQETITLTTR